MRPAHGKVKAMEEYGSYTGTCAGAEAPVQVWQASSDVLKTGREALYLDRNIDQAVTRETFLEAVLTPAPTAGAV